MVRATKRRKLEEVDTADQSIDATTTKSTRQTRAKKVVSRSSEPAGNAKTGLDDSAESKYFVKNPEKPSSRRKVKTEPHEVANEEQSPRRRKRSVHVKEESPVDASSTIQPQARKLSRKISKELGHPPVSDAINANHKALTQGVESKTAESARNSTPKDRRRGPKLKKENSHSAEIALRKIAEEVNSFNSDSDSSRDTKLKFKVEQVSDAHDDDDDDDEVFEDVDLSTKNRASVKFDADEDETAKDLQLTLEKAERLQLAKTGKTKQSARAVHERCFCHYMSTISMVAIGAWRNIWINDGRLHKVLRNFLRTKAPMLHKELAATARHKGSRSIGFVELMGRVMKHFNTSFKRTKPGLRKLGHRAVSQMDAADEFCQYAESFPDFESFLAQAKMLEGSRDFGAQLFSGLLRAYHFKVRLVFSTQPLGFKFNEREEFRKDTMKSAVESVERSRPLSEDTASANVINLDSNSEASEVQTSETKRRPSKRRSGAKDDAICLDDDSDLSDVKLSDYVSDPDLLSDVDDSTAELELAVRETSDKDSRPDSELEYPIFWTEVYDIAQTRWIAIDAMVKHVVLIDEKGFKSLHPRGSKAEQQKLTLGFVVAYDANKYAKDVTMRYASSWAKVKEVFLRADGKSNTRYDVNKILVRMSNPFRDEVERQEDETLAFKEYKRPPADEMPKSLADFKSSPKYMLDKQLREKEAFKPGAKSIGSFTHGKGAKEMTSEIYLRTDTMPCKTIENYHKEGRRIMAGEQPRKMIKARAMTTNRIREHQQQLAETGEEHVMQGIYSIDQTEYIIPPPIRDGVIPKNAYGNADVFVESMIPAGATHLKLKGVARVARKLEIDHAEAVVGFEFKKRGAIPVVLGVLVADENADRLEAAWQEAEELRIRKEDKKRSDAALKTWARFLKGLRIRHRINAEYGIKTDLAEVDGTMTVPDAPAQKSLLDRIADQGPSEDEAEDGGFLRE